MGKQSTRQRLTGIIAAYKEVFGSEQGEKVLLHLMKMFHVCNPIVRERATDPTQLMEFREGQRSVVLSILKTLGTDLDRYKEYIDRYVDEMEDVYGDD